MKSLITRVREKRNRHKARGASTSNDGTWDDCGFPVPPMGMARVPSIPVFGRRNLTKSPKPTVGSLLAAAESYSRPTSSLGNIYPREQAHFLTDSLETVVGVDQAVTSRQSISGDSPQFRTLLNYAQPINRLPPEILSAIFRLVVGPVRATRLRDVLRLSSICHNWRVIILGDGVMWSGICVIGQDPMFIAQQLARCRGAPLYLFLSVPDAVFPVEQVSPLSRFSQAAQMIQTRRSQVRSISAKVGSCRAFKRVFGFDWPNLEGLTWIDACPPESRMHEQNPPLPEEHHRTPKLRYLSAKRGLPWEITGTTSLTTLKLEGPMDIDILKFLQVNPHLESLELTKLRVQPPPANVTSIELPNTIKVVMHDVEYAQLFACVTFPSLRYLTVDPIDRRQQPVEIALSQLQVLPTVTKLKIEYLPHMQHERISIAGLDRTNTTLFNLTERTRFGGGTPAIQALCRTSLPSVTSLSIGGGIPGFWFSLPSTAICTLISGLPRLQRLDLFPHRLSLTIMQHLRSYQHVCPELKILSIALVRSTCEEMFRLLSGFVSDRARSGQWVHRVDCVILKVPGEVYQHAKRTWESLSRGCRFEEYLRCGCSGEDACWQVPRVGTHPTVAVPQRYSYRWGPYRQVGT